MISDMPRKLPLYVYREKNRHGTVVFYFRIGKGERIRLPDYGALDFDAAYKAALSGTPLPSRRGVPADVQSLRWLIDRYRESAAWSSLSAATRKQRDLLFQKSIAKSGNADFRAVTSRDILNAVDERKATPFLANNFLKAMRGLFKWALLNGHVDADPTAVADALPTKTEGFPAWTLEDAFLFCAKHPIGTRERLAFELLLYSGLRRSDIVRAGRQHMTENIFSIRPFKTRKNDVSVTVEFPKSLLETISATPTGDLTFITGEQGRPFTVESFGNWFRDACRAAGIQKSAHGVRKLSATLAANGGATVHELMAQFGWTTFRQAEIYTKGAERAKLGVKNSRMLAEQIEAAKTPHLIPGAGNRSKKTTKSKG